MNNPKNLFIATFIIIISTYLYIFGEEKTMQIIFQEYLYLIALFLVCIAFLFFKFKLNKYEIVEFIPTNNFSLKSTILFFIIFELIDYNSKDGFKGMISQWFIYWVFGVFALVLTHTLNYYKNYKILQKMK
ncbi:hypothetical protein CPU12_02430 [Malaciobacter molluscorum LMG 25693]|uniref:Membrane protein n=1 Tax=Malaciobacter molluscorum LMG 25693 TaxID=870501 RepID=A0A2G1DKW9_9BACT|nr:hypothetical protein [Malaciobacter molluscorum]AXX92704.1 putative membrane protein [Malaciobacter molluscorum LMG 25693]PHO19121.1 hypothetical protein CPU12_02430 [Malaciobacter molluscorum LMG 25693]